MVVAEVEPDMPEGLYWDLQEPYHYTRLYQQGDKTYLAVGGEDHKTGHNEQNPGNYEKLKQYMQAHFSIKEFTHEWSSQYYEPADGLPYIGLSPFKDVYVATGYSGDGLVYGTVAGLLLKDMVLKQENAWSKAYDARRFKPVASFGNWAKENIEVASDMVKDYLGVAGQGCRSYTARRRKDCFARRQQVRGIPQRRRPTRSALPYLPAPKVCCALEHSRKVLGLSLSR